MASEIVKFKVSLVYLLPILASLLFGLGCAMLLRPPQDTSTPVSPPIMPPVVPFPDESVPGTLGNAVYFVILVAVGATIMLFLLKQKKANLIKVFLASILTMASLLLSGFYLLKLLEYTNFYSIYLLCGLAILITVLFDLAIFKYPKIRNIAVICFGGAFGVFLGFLIPLYSAIAILIALSIYDVYAVTRGAVGKIAQSSGLDQFNGLSYSFKEIQMGLGDLVFYTMLMSVMYFSFTGSILPTIMALIGICVGSIITVFALTKKEIFPGLPFPVALGITLGLLTTLIV